MNPEGMEENPLPPGVGGTAVNPSMEASRRHPCRRDPADAGRKRGQPTGWNRNLRR